MLDIHSRLAEAYAELNRGLDMLPRREAEAIEFLMRCSTTTQFHTMRDADEMEQLHGQ